MNLNTKITLGAALMLTLGCASAADLKIGDRLPLAKAKSLTQQTLQVGKEALRVVGKSAEGTLVANNLGAVGLSRHDVLVSGVKPEQVRTQVSALGLRPSEAGYYTATGLSSLRFATLSEAMSACAMLKSALAGAVVTLPVQYAEVKPR